MFLIYKATNTVNGKKYIGVTKNFKKRLNSHKYSSYPFGAALRKYGIEKFVFEFEEYEDESLAYKREEELVTEVEIRSSVYYNCITGGIKGAFTSENNPMTRDEVKSKHTNLWTTENNPMNNTESKSKMIKSQSCKEVSVEGVVYYGVREAARKLGVSRQNLVHRLRSKNFPDYFYV